MKSVSPTLLNLISRMRFLALFLLLSAFAVLPFIVWGDAMESFWTVDQLQAHGEWAWAVGVGLLMADLFLPLPGTVIMSGLGLIYGVWVGGLLSALGSFLAGLLAYGLCRLLGRRAALWLIGDDGLRKGEALFRKSGPWLVAISRWLPILAEVIACLAGLSRMPIRLFVIALVCGSLPIGFAFAGIGAIGQTQPGVAIAISLIAPPLLWLVARKLLPKNYAD